MTREITVTAVWTENNHIQMQPLDIVIHNSEEWTEEEMLDAAKHNADVFMMLHSSVYKTRGKCWKLQIGTN
jgi:hypothetical protein